MRKHIRQMHKGLADIYTMSNEEARRTINQYKARRRQGQGHRHVWPIASSSTAATAEAGPSTSQAEAPSNSQSNPEQPGAPIQPPVEPVKQDEEKIVVTSPSAFRCQFCKRPFQTYTSLKQHIVFNHQSGNDGVVGSGKRSYKKALLQKALASPSANRVSPFKFPSPSMVSFVVVVVVKSLLC